MLAKVQEPNAYHIKMKLLVKLASSQTLTLHGKSAIPVRLVIFVQAQLRHLQQLVAMPPEVQVLNLNAQKIAFVLIPQKVHNPALVGLNQMKEWIIVFLMMMVILRVVTVAVLVITDDSLIHKVVKNAPLDSSALKMQMIFLFYVMRVHIQVPLEQALALFVLLENTVQVGNKW